MARHCQIDNIPTSLDSSFIPWVDDTLLTISVGCLNYRIGIDVAGVMDFVQGIRPYVEFAKISAHADLDHTNSFVQA